MSNNCGYDITFMVEYETDWMLAAKTVGTSSRLRAAYDQAWCRRSHLDSKAYTVASSRSADHALVVIGCGYEAPNALVIAGHCFEHARTAGLDVCRGKLAHAPATSQYAAG